MSDYHINLFYSEEDDGYIADIPDLEACSAFGSTPQEALTEVLRAKEGWIARAIGVLSSQSHAIGRHHTPELRLNSLALTL